MKFEVGNFVSSENFPNKKCQIVFIDLNHTSALIVYQSEDNCYHSYWSSMDKLCPWLECNDFNMKVVCTKTDGYIPCLCIPGKVYEIKNGQLIWPNGCRCGLYTSLDDLNNNGLLGQHCQFIEFKGED